MENQKKIVVLDRDGVINQDSDDYIKSVDEWKPIPGSIDAIADLYKAGYKIFVFTNQSGIARGYFTEEILASMHEKMTSLVEEAGGNIEKIFYCPHGPDDDCFCRKPKPGMLLDIQEYLGDDLAGAKVIGDSLKDLDAALSVNAMPIFVLTGKGSRFSKEDVSKRTELVFNDLSEAKDFLLRK